MKPNVKHILFIIAATFIVPILGIFLVRSNNGPVINNIIDNQPRREDELHPLTIESLRKGEYPGSEVVIEKTLEPGSNYKRYVSSYKSDGLKIYALLTVPNRDPSSSPQDDNRKFPVIVFNHGYIPPSEYQTTERYLAYTDAFSRNGYIVFKPDYRGHGDSEGNPSGAYGSPDYTIDVLNALASMKKFKDADPNKIGMWGHSMGGYITLRAMVVNNDIKAGVIWGGVVASYQDLLSRWRRNPVPSAMPGNIQPTNPRGWRNTLAEKYGTPEQNPIFWNSISANSYLKDISGPIQLHHGDSDASVPVEFSHKLDEQLKAEGKTSEIYTYLGDDHNISSNLSIALQRSIEFFDRYLKY